MRVLETQNNKHLKINKYMYRMSEWEEYHGNNNTTQNRVKWLAMWRGGALDVGVATLRET